jgi:hypothetical protein
MNTIDAIFEDLGGARKFAEAIKVKPNAAFEMKRRKSIPVRYWPRLVDACRELGIRGVNYDVLVDLHRKDEKGEAA